MTLLLYVTNLIHLWIVISDFPPFSNGIILVFQQFSTMKTGDLQSMCLSISETIKLGHIFLGLSKEIGAPIGYCT